MTRSGAWAGLAACALALLALAACQRESSPATALVLSCASFETMSAEALAAAYGADNIRDQVLNGPEGDDFGATILFPDDPRRRLEIVWSDPGVRRHIASVSASGLGSIWTGPHGLAVGQSLIDVESANRRVFKLWGFGWDYGGWVSNWNGGELVSNDGCAVRVRFSPSVAGSPHAVGDTEFDSDNPEVRAANPVVSEFGLNFPGR